MGEVGLEMAVFCASGALIWSVRLGARNPQFSAWLGPNLVNLPAALSDRVTSMKIQLTSFAVTMALSLAVSGCTTIGSDTGRTTASAASAAPAAPETIISAMDGGLIGGAIGSSLRESDRREALQAEYRALEYTPAGKPVDWRGAGGVTGSVTAAQPYRVGSQDCRQYTHAVSNGGRNQSARGTACRNPDGSWTPLT